MLYKLIVFGLWRTVESNHADPALLITNPDVCHLPCAVCPAVPVYRAVGVPRGGLAG